MTSKTPYFPGHMYGFSCAGRDTHQPHDGPSTFDWERSEKEVRKKWDNGEETKTNNQVLVENGIPLSSVSSGDTSPPAGFTEKKMTINIVCVVASFCRSLYAAFFTRVKNRRDSQTDGAIARLVGGGPVWKRPRARPRPSPGPWKLMMLSITVLVNLRGKHIASSTSEDLNRVGLYAVVNLLCCSWLDMNLY